MKRLKEELIRMAVMVAIVIVVTSAEVLILKTTYIKTTEKQVEDIEKQVKDIEKRMEDFEKRMEDFEKRMGVALEGNKAKGDDAISNIKPKGDETSLEYD